ncbi:hypothetical protein KR026_001918, partial [Drosophila bipectinata]
SRLIFILTFKLDYLDAAQLNNTPKAERDFIFYNRLEKTGSQSMTRLIKNLGDRNGFETFRNIIRPARAMTDNMEEEQDLVDQMSELPEPGVYVEHANYVNFTEHDMPRPIYINMVRDPIQKVISAYYYQRHPLIFAQSLMRNPKKRMKSKQYFDTNFNDCVRNRIPPYCVYDSHNPFNGDWRRFSLHLCGNREICTHFNSETTTQIAKMNVEREYAVVGSWEDTNVTLAVLEAYIPRFFTNARKVYYNKTDKFSINNVSHDNHLDEDVESYLRSSFRFEIELYQFIKQRLYKQYIAVHKDEFPS